MQLETEIIFNDEFFFYDFQFTEADRLSIYHHIVYIADPPNGTTHKSSNRY